MMRSPIPIYDCHGHLGAHPDFPAYKNDPEEMIRVMDLLNIETLAVTSIRACCNDCPRGNAEVDAVLGRYPGRFRGYITVNPSPEGEALRELERWSGFHRPPLIKLHPDLQKYRVDEARCNPIWDYASQSGAVVLVHTWDSDPNCGPLLFPPIARAFPRASIILGHSGVTWRGYHQAIEAALASPNLFLDISGSQSHRTIIEEMVRRVGSSRILFGSDMPYLEAAVSLGRVLTAKIADADKQMILRDNFRRLLREEKPV
ncbi:MAG: amidohydrolase family protein [Acidobacteriota bacterium]|nr:amidohydrolase family protein [Acidobacteriota bacterium]